MIANNLNIVILAAGAGTRMRSELPKVLHLLASKPLLWHVLTRALSLKPNKLIVVYGYGNEQVPNLINNLLPDNDIIWVKQTKQLGTGHALKCASDYLDINAYTLVLYGDVPLIGLSNLQKMCAVVDGSSLVMLSAIVDSPNGYGRVVKDNNQHICQVIEHKDADPSQLAINEINTGVYLVPNKYLMGWLANLTNNNQQQEYYLTDIIALAYQDDITIKSIHIDDPKSSLGVNTKAQLEELERFYQYNLATKFLNDGLTIIDRRRIDIRGELSFGLDCSIDINCIFEGEVILGDNVIIGAGCVIKNANIQSNTIIKPYSHIDGAQIGKMNIIGPFARIRPQTSLADATHIGNFVEIKNSMVGQNSKINHLSYIGDANIGSNVNVGALSVTCNYDGANKHITLIKDNVFIGSGSQLVAPVTLGQNVVVGAGSTITKNVEDNALALSRVTQTSIANWSVKYKKHKK